MPLGLPALDRMSAFHKDLCVEALSLHVIGLGGGGLGEVTRYRRAGKGEASVMGFF